MIWLLLLSFYFYYFKFDTPLTKIIIYNLLKESLFSKTMYNTVATSWITEIKHKRNRSEISMKRIFP